ncbi:hypothetical protein WMY93_002453 [Mugilogobius chulae]|uniref:GH84 domain-containing protein n=1 Tax=Mugilogobius chulae TaxID=88201 RepID=A0AAW0Q3N5_9GOBI
MNQGGVDGEKRRIEMQRGGVVAQETDSFYGRPWTMDQRRVLFQWMQQWGLNTYLYGPKDDLKHRLLWREVYSSDEEAQLKTLIMEAERRDLTFIYALSPGQDIVFSSACDVSLLQRKLRQVFDLGCRAFALLFDDIDHSMCQADCQVFSSFAHAQVSVTNQIYQSLGEPQVFLFCPTEYCGSLCSPSVSKSVYLQTVGEELLPNISVIWTEDWQYCPERALTLALQGWMEELNRPLHAGRHSRRSDSRSSSDKTQSSSFRGTIPLPVFPLDPSSPPSSPPRSPPASPTKPRPRSRQATPHRRRSSPGGRPEEGAGHKTHSLRWKSGEGEPAGSFSLCEDIAEASLQLVGGANRAVLYDLYPYVWDLRNTALVAKAFVCWLDGRVMSDSSALGSWRNCFHWCGQSAAEQTGVESEPWVFKGGVSGEVQVHALLNCSLFPTSRLYNVRPYHSKDKTAVTRHPPHSQNSSHTHSNITELVQRLQDDQGEYPDSLLYHFPSQIRLDALPELVDVSVSRTLLTALLTALKANGSQGVFCEVQPTDRQRLEFLTKLGFLEILRGEARSREGVVMGRLL